MSMEVSKNQGATEMTSSEMNSHRHLQLLLCMLQMADLSPESLRTVGEARGRIQKRDPPWALVSTWISKKKNGPIFQNRGYIHYRVRPFGDPGKTIGVLGSRVGCSTFQFLADAVEGLPRYTGSGFFLVAPKPMLGL